jgi:superfamily II DNA or RNA helicase
MTKKDSIQLEVLNKWLVNKFGSVILGTGVGKSKLGTDAIKSVEIDVSKYDIPILIGVDTTANKTVTWVNELKKWGINVEDIQIECYQTLYKWKNKKIGLFIADELDVALTPEYFKTFINNDISNFLGFTATITEDKEEMLNTFAPIIFRFSSKESQEADLINKTVIIEHNVLLSDVSNIKTKYGSWSEISKYKWYSKKIDKLDGDIALGWHECNMLTKDMEIAAKKGALAKLYVQNKNLKNQRAKFLKELESLDKYSSILTKLLLQDPNNKVLLFAKYTKTIDTLGNSYHSKNKKGNTNIEKFNNAEIRSLGVCKTVSRGISFKNLNQIVGHSYDGTDTYYTQALQGRATRLDTKELAFIHILIPILKEGNKITDTRARHWYDKMTINVKQENKYTYDGKTNILQYCKDIKEERKEV